MKKILSVFLCAVLLVSIAVPHIFARENTIMGEINDYPVVVVPGYSSAWLYYGESREEATPAWSGMDVTALVPNLKNRIIDLCIGAATMKFDNAEKIGKTLAEEMKNTWPLIGFNKDGTSKYDLNVYYFKASETTSAYLDKVNALYCSHDRENMDVVEEYIGKENIYNFNVDWRMGTEYCANKLNEYIKDVKQVSGKEKVNIIATSQGGQITSTYLYLYGDQGDVQNVVMSSPAIGGSHLAVDMLTADVHLREDAVVEMIEHFLNIEDDYEWLLKAQELGFLDDILNETLSNLRESIGFWGSIWDLVPASDYEAMKSLFLSSPECEPLVKQSDRFHYDIQPNFKETFEKCKKNGMNISILAGTNNGLLSGGDYESDGVIDVATATGATVTNWGKCFSDGYTQVNDCNGKYKISPSRTIDASTCYLPDNTWFVDNIYHGWTYFTPWTRYLALTLLLSNDGIKDVYSNEDYPQFLSTDNASRSVIFSFNNSTYGYISGQANKLEIKNILEKSNIRIVGIYSDNIPLQFKLSSNNSLSPGETMEVEFTGDIPESTGNLTHITVCYLMDNNTPLSYRTLPFTVINGQQVEGEKEIVDIGATTPIAKILPEFAQIILSRLGLKELLETISVIICTYFRFI